MKLVRVLPRDMTADISVADYWVVEVKAQQTPLVMKAADAICKQASSHLKRITKADNQNTKVLICRKHMIDEQTIEKALDEAGVEKPFKITSESLVDKIPVMKVSHHNQDREGL